MKPDHQQEPPRPSGEAQATTETDSGSDNEDEDMSNQQQQEPTAVAQAINGFAEMSMEHTAGCNYSVFSWRNGNNTVHRVNTAQMTCTCEDMKWNRDGETDVCDHVAYAVYHAPNSREVGTEAFNELLDMVSSMNDYRRALEQRRQSQEKAAEVASTEPDSKPSLEETTPEPTHDPEEKADALREAFNAVVEDMEVEVGDGGAIWVKTGYDTPETINTPGPGGPIEVWEAFIKNPEQTEYVPDDHPAAGDRPSEYHKNRIEPGDVEAYIEEVLK